MRLERPARFLAATIEAIAQAIPVDIAMTPREIEARLLIYHSRSTVRAVLSQLSREGRAVAEGDILQRRYRSV